MRAVWQWAVRLEALAGLLPGEVSESAEAYFRMMGAVFVALAIVMVILARVVGLVYLRPVILPDIGQVVPSYTTTSTVVKVLPPHTYSPPGYPYGFWDSRRDKAFFARDPRVHIGDRVTMSWGYGNYLRHIIINGRFFDVMVLIPFPLEISVLLVGGTWLLAVLLALLCFRNARRIHRDLHAVPEPRSLTVETSWCPWSKEQAVKTAGPLAYPVFVRAGDGQRLALSVPATIRLGLHPGTPVRVGYYPHTHALDPVSIEPLVADTPAGVIPQRQSLLWTLLARLNIAAISTQARLVWRLLTGVRVLSSGVAAFALYVAWMTLPTTVPDWFPVSASHPTVTRVYAPYTVEPAYYPYEIAASDGHLYWFAHNPNLRVGDTLTVRRDVVGGFLSISHNGFAGSAGRHDHPFDVLILVGVSLAGLWSVRRRVVSWEIPTEAVSERAVLVKGLPLLHMGYPITVRSVLSGRTFSLQIPRDRSPEAERLLRAAGEGEFIVTYYPHSGALVNLDIPDVGSLTLPEVGSKEVVKSLAMNPLEVSSPDERVSPVHAD